MPLADLPELAAWRHVEARVGFEVAFFARADGVWRCVGTTTAVEDGKAWAVRYEIQLNADWSTRFARIGGRSATGGRSVILESVATGRWLIDDAPAPHLDGLVDIDLEASVVTNAFPMRRLELGVDQAADAPAVYVRAGDLTVGRLEQHYVRLPDGDETRRFRYSSLTFDFTAELEYDISGLVTTYPGLATRVA